ncbi:hypothetical protein NGM10_16625 (plasmid) [Halorussus salilacus]|uniref:helix-turn-helix transcriptional regulator n=1 Tax=Halorussus salilacus TaxID=2953750 RepID=UPI00209FAEA0|nr:hypothetical protein [Halorussus salilacus]USZ69723.1 hypothetical protein NGM10_16625 [Halorussus salilacus]
MSPDSAAMQKCLRNRSHFLRRLRRPHEKCELARELRESRSTIDRAVRELESAGFVDRTEDGYRTTLAGKLALEDRERHAARLDGIARFREALAGLAPDAPLDAALFEDAEVSLPESYSPHEPVETLASFLAEASHVRLFASAVVSRYVDLYRERVEAGMTADLVFAEEVFEWLLARRKEDVSALLGTSGVSVSRTPLDRSFSLVLIDRADRGECADPADSADSAARGTRTTSAADAGSVDPASAADRSDRAVGVMLYDDGSILGFVRTDSREAVAWADDLFERVASEAARVGRSPDARDGGVAES